MEGIKGSNPAITNFINYNNNAYKSEETNLKYEKSSNESGDGEVAGMKKQFLESMLKNCEILSKSSYTAISWNELMKTYASAKAIAIQDSPSVKSLNKAINALTSSLAGLETEPVKKDKDDTKKDNLPVVIDLSSSDTANVELLTQAAAQPQAPQLNVALE